jgi:hypothetical protein
MIAPINPESAASKRFASITPPFFRARPVLELTVKVKVVEELLTNH